MGLYMCFSGEKQTNLEDRELMDEKTTKWMEPIVKYLFLTDWTIKYEPREFVDGITLFDSKTIIFRFPEGKPDFATILHELCHAHCSMSHLHDSEFAYLLTDLVRQFCKPKE